MTDKPAAKKKKATPRQTRGDAGRKAADRADAQPESR